MPKIKVKGQTVQTGERQQANGRTHTHTDATKRITVKPYAVDKLYERRLKKALDLTIVVTLKNQAGRGLAL